MQRVQLGGGNAAVGKLLSERPSGGAEKDVLERALAEVAHAARFQGIQPPAAGDPFCPALNHREATA